MEAKESCQEPSLQELPHACLGRDEQCPLCGQDNQCRVAKGHLYKGPCWCHEIIVPGPILTRLVEDKIEPSCLCRSCLETVARLARESNDVGEILVEMRKIIPANRGQAAVLPASEDYYLDPDGNMVFTAAYHLKRGNCCANGCRHCPY